MRKIATLLASLLWLASCATRRENSNQDVEVLSAVAAQLCTHKSNGVELLSSLTASVSREFTPSNLDESARESLFARNRSRTLLPELNICKNLRRTDGGEIDNYLENRSLGGMPERWIAFYKKYVDAEGVTWLSMPGYSTEGDLAIVQVSGACDYLCGSGFFWVLRKTAGQWQVERSIQGWTG